MPWPWTGQLMRQCVDLRFAMVFLRPLMGLMYFSSFFARFSKLSGRLRASTSALRLPSAQSAQAKSRRQSRSRPSPGKRRARRSTPLWAFTLRSAPAKHAKPAKLKKQKDTSRSAPRLGS